MRLILSVLAAVAGIVMLVVGGVQFAEASKVTTITASGTTTSGAPLLVASDSVLAAHAGSQRVRIEGDGPIVAVVGRTGDVTAWVGDTKHDVVAVETAERQGGSTEPLSFTTAGTEDTAPALESGDLWLEVQRGEGSLEFDAVVAPGYSMLIGSDGTQPAPTSLAITWPHGGYAPWSGPLLVGGGLMLVIAALLMAWSIVHRRRLRRDAELLPPELPKVAEPLDADVVAAADANVAEGETAQWSVVNWTPAEETEPAIDIEALERELEQANELDVTTPFEPVSDDDEPLHTDTITLPPLVGSQAVTSAPVPEQAEFAEPEFAEPELAEPDHEEAAPAASEAAFAELAEAQPVPAEPVEAPVPATPESQEPEHAASDADDDSKWRRPRGRNRSSAPRQSFFVAPIALVAALTLAGCAPQYWPSAWTGADVAPTGTPTSTADAAILEEGGSLPVLSADKINEILADAGQLAGEADAALDASLLEPRFGGDALAERTAMYAATKADAALPGAVPFPAGEAVYVVPEATDGWPRTVFTVVNASTDASASTAPFAVTLEQTGPRDPYLVVSLVQLSPGVSLPDAPPAEIGAGSLESVAANLAMSPDEVAAAYADIIAKGATSEFADKFSAENDTLREQVNQAYRDAEAAKLDPQVATLAFAYAASDTAATGVASLEGGAIIAVSITESEMLKAVSDRSRISVAGRTAALSGLSTSQYGFERVYTDQVLFYVPPASSGAKIQFLGASQAMTSARELTKEEAGVNG
ncbi:hypothetical protein EG850_10175 [Gulosibacter macacae]|uniref:Glycosyl transferase n=1 Tax=Gulosibacter macacae TaxID=2488791 RepID=A0A3P3VVP2_9MICO|nr:hypothetical protein [Gulosibacter macacae]RRJ86078.1 hypothetical protein EG850_10175 [Gulosibacter macacae]